MELKVHHYRCEKLQEWKCEIMTYQRIISAYQQLPSNTSKTAVHQSRMCVWSAHALRAHCVLPLCLEIRQLLLLHILFALQPGVMFILHYQITGVCVQELKI